MSNKQPNNILLRIVISIFVILGIFVAGSFLLQMRERAAIENPTPVE